MSKILYFVGHYDYLIYNILYRSGITSPSVEADFIVQEVKNSEGTISFLRQKSQENSRIGRFAAINDESFLGKHSKEETLEAIADTYDSALAEFGCKLQDYDRIYMSFDEWNSFGIYLSQFEQLPPVGVFVKYEKQLQAEIYHYLDTPGKLRFSELQKKYRVLNAQAPYISEIIVLQENCSSQEYDTGYQKASVKGFDITQALSELDEERYTEICRFFLFDPETFSKEKYFLLVADSYWFKEMTRRPVNEYTRMYQTFLDWMDPEGMPVLFKLHPRQDIVPSLRGSFHGTDFIEGYVPVELLAYRQAPELEAVYSVGNPVFHAFYRKTRRCELVNNEFVFHYTSYARLDCFVRFCEKNGYKRVIASGVSPVMLDIYKRYINQDCQVTFLPSDTKTGFGRKIVLCQNAKKKEFTEKAKSLLNKGCSVFVLNPEYDFDLGEELGANLTAITFRRYGDGDGTLGAGAYEQLWCFSKSERMKKQLSYFSWQKRLPFSGWRIRIGLYPGAVELLSQFPKHSWEKEYIRLRARTSPVLVYGAGSIAREFVKKFESVLNICLILTDEGETVDPWLAARYETVPFTQIDFHKEDYCIVCKPFIHNLDQIPPYAQARDDLLRRGMAVCRDFTYYRIFDAIWQGQEIILFCGYCELGGLKQVLDLTSAAREYCMLFYHIGRETMVEAPGYDDFVAAARLCDILIHAPLTVTRNVMDADVLSMIKPGTRTIFVPQISFRGYAPYKIKNFQRRNASLFLFGVIRYPFLYQIRNVNVMILNGRTNSQILARLKQPDLFSEEQIRKNLQDALRILEIMDAKADIPIYDFVRDHYQDEMLFKDSIHANDIIFFEYARRLSDYLGKDWRDEINAAEVQCKKDGAYFQVASEEPILPCVAKTLGLKFAGEDRLYMEKVTEERIRMRTFDEWYTDYCEYFRAVLRVNRTLNRNYQTREVTIYRNETEEYRMRRP